jgi:hypothetical protein
MPEPTRNEAQSAFDRLAEAVELMMPHAAATQLMNELDARVPYIELRIHPKRNGAAPISIRFHVNEGLLHAAFGRHATSREWVETSIEFAMAIENIIGLIRAVICGGLVERSVYAGGTFVRSTAVLHYDGFERKIIDGRPISIVKTLFRRRHRIETVYVPYGGLFGTDAESSSSAR